MRVVSVVRLDFGVCLICGNGIVLPRFGVCDFAKLYFDSGFVFVSCFLQVRVVRYCYFCTFLWLYTNKLNLNVLILLGFLCWIVKLY